MFKTLPPWLVFNGPAANGGNVDPSTLSDEDFLAQKGFPRNTSTDDMTPEQEAKYWRDKSKSFQRDSEAKGRELSKWTGLGEFDAVNTTIQTAEQQRQAALSAEERARENAQQVEAAARAAGEAAGAQLYLGDAIAGQVAVLAIQPGEKPEEALARVKGALQFTDPAKFLNAEKHIDPALVAQFAASVAPTADANDGKPDVLTTLYQRQSAPPPGSGGSISEARKQTRERLTKPKQ